MSVERLKLIAQETPKVLTPEDWIRLLYDKVGHIGKVSAHAAKRYQWSPDKTRDVLAWDIANRKATRPAGGRGKRSKVVQDIFNPALAAEAQRLYVESGSEDKVAEHLGKTKREVRKLLATADAERRKQKEIGQALGRMALQDL